VQIPGQHVKTLTSASKLINEYHFKNRHQRLVEDYESKFPALKEDATDE
tara:strand:+ start:793 stop:939 length:147 start_codon:yes stop_codon:yes gene_type:complete